MENKKKFHEGQKIKVVWENDGLMEKNYGEIVCRMDELGFSGGVNYDEWLVEIKDNKDDTTRMIQVWDDEMFEIKEVK